LSDKADSAYIFLTCNNNLKAGSNGLLTNIVPLPGNKLRYEWKTYYPIDYYLLSFTVSTYQEYNLYAHPAGLTDSILVQNYLYDNSGYLPYFQSLIDQTPGFIELLSDLYGMYPFKDEKYGHCTAPIGGGMEHQTMTTLSSFSFELIIHELGHQWFGDHVTCSNWQDIWVNEGFATYTHYLGLQNLVSQTDADQEMLTIHSDIMTAADGSIYVPISQIADEARIFDYRLTYEKGAAIIHTMRFILNDDILFFNVLRNFQSTYGFNVASAEDFKNMITTMSGYDFTDYFNQWYYGEGYPTYNVAWNQQGNNLDFVLSQQTSMPGVTPFFKLPVEIKFLWSGGDTIIRFDNTQNYQLFSANIPHVIQSLEIDPNNWIINDVGSISLSTKDNLFQQLIKYYPNPVTDKINVEIPAEYLSKSVMFTITDVTGKQIMELNPLTDHLKIDTRNLNKGIYFIKNSLNGNLFKFIKIAE
jgi:aminopeptidase N